MLLFIKVKTKGTLEGIKTLSFAAITNAIGSAINFHRY